MKTWQKWFDEVLSDVAGVPQEVAVNAIRNAVIEFLDRSWVYRADHAPIDAVMNQGTYAYVPAAGYKVAVATAVWFSGKKLYPKTIGQLEELYSNWATETASAPLYFLQEGLEGLRVVPAPNAALVGAITLKVALKPTRAATGVDDTIWEKYLEEIACGGKAKLFAMKRKPWSDPGRAQAYKAEFDQHIAVAKLAADRGFARGKLRVRAHFF